MRFCFFCMVCGSGREGRVRRWACAGMLISGGQPHQRDPVRRHFQVGLQLVGAEPSAEHGVDVSEMGGPSTRSCRESERGLRREGTRKARSCIACSIRCNRHTDCHCPPPGRRAALPVRTSLQRCVSEHCSSPCCDCQSHPRRRCDARRAMALRGGGALAWHARPPFFASSSTPSDSC